MTLLEKAKADGIEIRKNINSPNLCPCDHGYETKEESKAFCAGHTCEECYAREYKGPDPRANPLTISKKLSLIDEYLTELTDPRWRDMIQEYREYLTRQTGPEKAIFNEPQKAINRESILQGAIECTCTDRNNQYGGPERSFAAIAEMWTAYMHCKGHDTTINAHDAAMMLTLFKAARVTTSDSPKADTYVDLAGYASCAGEIACGGSDNG